LNARSRETGLHLAAKFGRPEALRVLLKLGADPKAKGRDLVYYLNMTSKYFTGRQ